MSDDAISTNSANVKPDLNTALRKALPELTAYCLKQKGVDNDKDLTDEIVQRTLIKAWQRWDTYDPSKCSLSTWLRNLLDLERRQYLHREFNRTERLVPLPDEL